MRQTDGNARCHTAGHLLDSVAIAAGPADQHSVIQSVSFAVAETLATSIENGSNLAVVAPREHEAYSLAGIAVVAIAQSLSVLESPDVDLDRIGARHRDAPRSDQRNRCETDHGDTHDASSQQEVSPGYGGAAAFH
jgi:hypothetical protein